jgi:hypothetical protein
VQRMPALAQDAGLKELSWQELPGLTVQRRPALAQDEGLKGFLAGTAGRNCAP